MASGPNSGTLLYSRDEQNSDFDDIWDDTALICAYDKAVRKAKSMIRQRQKSNSTTGSVNESSTASEGSKRNRNKCRPKGGNKEKSSNTKLKIWTVGECCRALYSDGRLYEAEVLSVSPEEETCVVHFVGYGNSETVHVENLHPSHGEEARARQVAQAESVLREEEPQDHKYQKSSRQNKKVKENAKISKGSNRNRQSWNFQQAFPSSNPMPGSASKGPSHTSFTQPFPPFEPAEFADSFVMMPPPPPPLRPQLGNMEEEEDETALSSMLMSWYMSGYHTGYYQGLKYAKCRYNCPCCSSSNHEPSDAHAGRCMHK